MSRDDFTNPTKETLAKRVGNVCSRPGCGQTTSGPHSEDKKHVNVGVAAHITAAASGGPRYDESLTAEERKSPTNGIWLCQTCAKLVDSDESRYTTEDIKRWKQEAEDTADARLKGSHPNSDAHSIRFAASDWELWRVKPWSHTNIVRINVWKVGELRYSCRIRIRNESDEEILLEKLRVEFRQADSFVHKEEIQDPIEIFLKQKLWQTVEVSGAYRFGLTAEEERQCSSANSVWFAANIVGENVTAETKISDIKWPDKN